MLIGALVTFLVVILILYLVNLLPLDGRAKQIARSSSSFSAYFAAEIYRGVLGARLTSRQTKKPRRPGLGRFSAIVSGRSSEILLQRPEPVVHVLVDLVLGEAVALLQLAFELFAAAFDHIEVVVGEFTPLFLCLRP